MFIPCTANATAKVKLLTITIIIFTVFLLIIIAYFIHCLSDLGSITYLLYLLYLPSCFTYLSQHLTHPHWIILFKVIMRRDTCTYAKWSFILSSTYTLDPCYVL